jgi:hypothetical protein
MKKTRRVTREEDKEGRDQWVSREEGAAVWRRGKVPDSGAEWSDATALDSWVEGTVRQRMSTRLCGRNYAAPPESALSAQTRDVPSAGVPHRRPGREEGNRWWRE